MQAFNLDNNTFQLKFPRPSSKSQPKPPKDLKVESITQKECIIAKDIPRKILSDISNPNLENTQNDKSFIGGYQENINTMLIENEKMRRKIEFLQIILENTLKFDESRNVFELKNFVRANYKRFHGILDEIYTYKEEIVKTQELRESIEKETTKKNEEVFKKIETISDPVEKEINQYENKLQEINKEIKEINLKNEKLRDQVNKKPFFREFELMGKEEEGLKKQNQSLQEMIKRELEKKK